MGKKRSFCTTVDLQRSIKQGKRLSTPSMPQFRNGSPLLFCVETQKGVIRFVQGFLYTLTQISIILQTKTRKPARPGVIIEDTCETQVHYIFLLVQIYIPMVPV